MAPLKQKNNDSDFSIGIIRFLSWISLVLILACNIVLSALITNQARDILIEKQKNFARLLAQSADYQIYRRYSIPLALGSRALVLSDKTPQFEPLEQVLSSVLQGANVDSVRIYAYNSAVTFSTFPSEIGKRDIAPALVEKVRNNENPEFEMVSSVPPWLAMFSFSPEPGTYTLKVTYPLNAQNRLLSFEGDGPKLDILEFSQDITEDYEAIIRFQWSILALAFISSLILFSLLQVFIRRTEKILSAKMLEKERLERELHQSEKLASMGRVVSSIAHEIRNPLGIIRSSSELLLRRQKKEGENSANVELLKAIHDESCRLSSTITDFLDYARPKLLSPQQVDLAQLIEQALVFLGNSMEERNISVHRSIPPEVWVSGEKDLIYRAIYNILSNAAQALENGGDIHVEAFIDDDSVDIVVKDSGPGFSEEALIKALDPFFTTKEDGTGLGLAIVQSIISSHNGKVEISNNKTGGANVRVTLPRHIA